MSPASPRQVGFRSDYPSPDPAGRVRFRHIALLTEEPGETSRLQDANPC